MDCCLDGVAVQDEGQEHACPRSEPDPVSQAGSARSCGMSAHPHLDQDFDKMIHLMTSLEIEATFSMPQRNLTCNSNE